MSSDPAIARVYEFPRPDPLRGEIHATACDCPACAPYLQPAPEVEPPLSLVQIGNRVWLGLAIGTMIAFACDPRGAWAALLAVLR